MDIIVGTAGHIDHGKTALVKALTGIDADRLPEEKQRGITIDLGFAELDLEGVRIGFVDVPGHERFVKNMLAGAIGIDLVLLVIAANEGVMPQTREHFEICRLLGIKAGLIVITKADLADAELLELVKLETAELVANSFLEGSQMISVSAKTGDGIDEFKQQLGKAAAHLAGRTELLVTQLPIDRSFTIKGYGSVVTGTLVSGEISEGDEMELLPDGLDVRVRGVQTHNRSVKTARGGQRTAVNLGGIDHSQITRGMVLSERGILRPTQIFDAEIEILKDAKKPLRSRQRVRVHVGTVEAMARITVINERGEITQGNNDFVQIRLENPVITLPGERFIIRSYSPQSTIGGGRVLDIPGVKHRKKDFVTVVNFLCGLAGADDDTAAAARLIIESACENALNFSDLQARTGWRKEILLRAIDQNLQKGFVVQTNEFYIAKTPFETLKSKAATEIEYHHRREPLSKGLAKETLREKLFRYVPDAVFRAVISDLEKAGKITVENDMVRLKQHRTDLSEQEIIVRNKLSSIYQTSGFEVPKLDEALAEATKGSKFDRQHVRKIFQLLINSGEIVKISEEFYFSQAVIDDLLLKVRAFASVTRDRLIDVPKFKEIAGVSRKYAIPLMEYFDREKVTIRAGDKRLIL